MQLLAPPAGRPLPGVRPGDMTFASNQVRIRLPRDPLKGWTLTQAVVSRLVAAAGGGAGRGAMIVGRHSLPEDAGMDKSPAVDRYISSLSAERRPAMEALRAAVNVAAPNATETIAYGMPALRSDGGQFLVSYDAYKRHYSLFPASEAVIEAGGERADAVPRRQGDDPVPGRRADPHRPRHPHRQGEGRGERRGARGPSAMAGDAAPEIELRPWSPDDLDLMIALLGDPAMTEHLGGPETPERPPETARSVSLDGAVRRPDVRDHAWVRTAQPAGSVGYWPHESGSLETGWSVLPAFQGRGVATRGTAQCLDLAAAVGGYETIHAYPSVDNVPSNALSRTLGFELLARSGSSTRRATG